MRSIFTTDELARILCILLLVCYVCGFIFIWNFIDAHVSFGHVSLTSPEDFWSPPDSLSREIGPVNSDYAEHRRGAK